MIHTKVAVVLETMWGDHVRRAPRWFRINQYNHSGKRLYKLVDSTDLLVTNACKYMVTSPNDHGKPDPVWLAENLQRVHCDLLLVCGKVAQETFDKCRYTPLCKVLKMPHPAWRGWTKALLKEWQHLIKESLL